MSNAYEYFVATVWQLLAIDSVIFVFGGAVLAIYSVKKHWDPTRTNKYAFWGLLQIFALMVFAVSLVVSPWYEPIIVLGIPSILIFLLWKKLTDKAMAKKEDVYGKEYWKKPGTRGKGYLFLYKEQIHALHEQERILESRPDNAEAWHKRGLTLKELGEEQEAALCFEKAEQLNPNLAKE